MRPIIMWNQVSADGFFAAPDGGLDWVAQDPEVQRAGLAGSTRTGMLLFGRKTFEMFASFWPRMLEEPDLPDPHGGPRAPELVGFARFLTGVPKLVFSTTLREPRWQNTRVASTLDPAALAALKQEHGGPIMIMGSASVVAQLTEHGLIDEYQFSVSPVLLGQGRTLLDGVAKRTPLRLVETRTFPSGTLLVRYARG